MGGVSTPKLVAAVSNAGALGMVNLSGVGGGGIAKVFDDLAERTTRPVGANFLMPFLDMSAVELAAERCRLVEFFYAIPSAHSSTASMRPERWRLGRSARPKKPVPRPTQDATW